MIHPQVQEHIETIKDILRKNHVKKAYLFGSAVTERFKEGSDIDLLIQIDSSLSVLDYGNSYWNILFDLEDFLHREIDLLTEDSLKNPYLIQSIDENRVEIL